MKTLKFSVSEVIAFLEEKISMEEANQDESNLYEEYQWNQKLKNNNTCKALVKEMNKLWNEKF